MDLVDKVTFKKAWALVFKIEQDKQRRQHFSIKFRKISSACPWVVGRGPRPSFS